MKTQAIARLLELSDKKVPPATETVKGKPLTDRTKKLLKNFEGLDVSVVESKDTLTIGLLPKGTDPKVFQKVFTKMGGGIKIGGGMGERFLTPSGLVSHWKMNDGDLAFRAIEIQASPFAEAEVLQKMGVNLSKEAELVNHKKGSEDVPLFYLNSKAYKKVVKDAEPKSQSNVFTKYDLDTPKGTMRVTYDKTKKTASVEILQPNGKSRFFAE